MILRTYPLWRSNETDENQFAHNGAAATAFEGTDAPARASSRREDTFRATTPKFLSRFATAPGERRRPRLALSAKRIVVKLGPRCVPERSLL